MRAIAVGLAAAVFGTMVLALLFGAIYWLNRLMGGWGLLIFMFLLLWGTVSGLVALGRKPAKQGDE